jgi:hypothetical protein
MINKLSTKKTKMIENTLWFLTPVISVFLTVLAGLSIINFMCMGYMVIILLDPEEPLPQDENDIKTFKDILSICGPIQIILMAIWGYSKSIL